MNAKTFSASCSLTRRYNVRHRKWGRLFGDRYKAVIVEGETHRELKS